MWFLIKLIDRWCWLLRPGKVERVLLLLVRGVSHSDFTDNPDALPYMNKAFPMVSRIQSESHKVRKQYEGNVNR